MTKLSAFTESLADASPPEGLGCELCALWWAGQSRWAKAHDQVDTASGVRAAWVHAYLHRWEGDLGNARYWYRQAGRCMPDQNLETEWRTLVQALIGERTSDV